MLPIPTLPFTNQRSPTFLRANSSMVLASSLSYVSVEVGLPHGMPLKQMLPEASWLLEVLPVPTQ
ncbi:hypothetical protein D3C83_212990 [compost metagenome]